MKLCPMCAFPAHEPDDICDYNAAEPGTQPSTTEPVETPVQVEFDWQPVEQPDLVEPEQSGETPVHKLVQQALNDPGQLLIVALGGAVPGRRLLGMLEQLHYPLQIVEVPSSIERPSQVGILDLSGVRLIELQALVDIFADASLPTPRLDDLPHGMLVMTGFEPGTHPSAAEIVIKAELDAVRAWASTGTFTPINMGDVVVASLEVAGAGIRQQAAA